VEALAWPVESTTRTASSSSVSRYSMPSAAALLHVDLGDLLEELGSPWFAFTSRRSSRSLLRDIRAMDAADARGPGGRFLSRSLLGIHHREFADLDWCLGM